VIKAGFGGVVVKISFEEQKHGFLHGNAGGVSSFSDADDNWCVISGNIYSLKSSLESKPREVQDKQALSVLELLLKKLKKSGSVDKAVFEAGRLIDGEFSCVAGLGETIVCFSDFLGSRPVWYLESKAGTELRTEVGTPKTVFGSSAGLQTAGLQTADPQILCRGRSLVHASGKNSFCDAFDVLDIKKEKKELFHPTVTELKEIFEIAVQKRLKGVKEAAVLFSGGVDSSTVAKSASDYCGVSLFVAGLSGSKDVVEAKKSANALGLPLTVVEVGLDEVEDVLWKVVPLIGTSHPMHAALAVTEFVAASQIKQSGLNVVLSGQGSDELFCSYHSFVETLSGSGFEGVERKVVQKLGDMQSRNLVRDYSVFSDFELDVRLPFLDRYFVPAALGIPCCEKILSVDDNLRKHPVRKMALELGVPKEIAVKPKKSMQYGSGSQDAVRAVARKNGFSRETHGSRFTEEFLKSILFR